ncbi:MAG: phosphatidylserine decarboxylase family protein [bacterium]|nr:phosphatidylserine decarboxylase family protein [bacterium]
MAREGYPFLAGSLGGAAIIGLIGAIISSTVLTYIALVLLFAGLFMLIFFRDPDREITAGSDDIVSPGDGLVVSIVDEQDNDYFKGQVKRISIFLSVFDVHVNRVPIDGEVDMFKYSKGQFKAAFKEDASEKNEQTVIGIVKDNRKVVFKQIAGLIARRIICYLEEGQTVKKGDRCGLIRFGSRVDVIVSPDVEILVKKGQRVKGGKSIIGKFNDEK